MPTYTCPICEKTVQVAQREDAPFRPFCSERCKLVDLGRWLDGTYSVSEATRDDELPEHEEGDDRPAE